MTTAVATFAAVTTLATGCSYPGDEHDRAASAPQVTATTTVTAEPKTTPDTKSTSSDSSASTALPKVDLSADKGTTYLAAHRASGLLSPPKVLGPWVVQWVIDGKDVTYKEIICTGTAVREATGTLEEGEDGQEVRWIDNGDGKADDPWVGNAATETTRLKIADERLKAPLQEEATSDVGGQTSTFVQHCKDAGEDVAEFLR